MARGAARDRQLQQQRLAEEKQALTFRPRLNASSSKVVRGSDKAEQRLMQAGAR